MREAFRGLKLREKKVYLCLLTTPKDLLNSIFITESFCGVQKKEDKFGEESLLETKPNGRETQKSKLRNVRVGRDF